MENRITPDNITTLKQNEVFVFGSNEAGVHGAGAALQAVKAFGAKNGCAIGPQGNSYAIPTKNIQINTLSLSRIDYYVDKFISFAKENPKEKFLVTEIGCGLAGYLPEHIGPLFEKAKDIENIYLPKRFWKYIK